MLVCLQVIIFPISLVLGNLVGGKPKNGIAEVEEPCYNNTVPSFTQPSVVCAKPQAKVCSEPEKYLYWVRIVPVNPPYRAP